MTEEFKVKVRLHYGLFMDPFLFAVLMERRTDKVKQKSLDNDLCR